MRNFFLYILYAVALVAVVSACTKGAKGRLARSGNAVYYWQTAFQLDSAEKDFLATYQIKTLYTRYFDVVMGDDGKPLPNATLRFQHAVPESLEVVPTVFIMNSCMQRGIDTDLLARQIVRRVVQMNETNDVPAVSELQIDCDYTLRNRELYYDFLTEAGREAHRHGMRLSATIRLHQLSMAPPPVDYGVLMLYNTGDPEQWLADGDEARNPILDYRDVEPYLRYLRGYSLPLAAAYPVFLWQRDIHGVHIDHEAGFNDIVRTKLAVERERDDLRQLILTYHLDTPNIERYSHGQYDTIYHH